jgi:ATP-dependent Lon protease
MPRDAQNKNNSRTRQAKKAEEEKRKRKQFEDSGSDSNSSDSESDELNAHEYRKFLHKLFPSKHLNDKVKAGEKLKKQLKTQNVCESEDEEDEIEEKKPYVSKRKRDKKKYEETESESDYETEESLGSQDTDEDSEYDDEDIIEEKRVVKSGSNKFNIIFTIGGSKKEDEDDDYEDGDEEDIWEDYHSDDEDETEDEDEPVSSDSDTEDDDEDEVVSKKNNKDKKDKTKERTNDKKVDKEDNLAILNKLKEMNNGTSTKMIQKCIELVENDINQEKEKEQKKEQKQKDKHTRIFKKIIKEKNTMNDFDFFEKLECESQHKIIKELREINKITKIEKPYRLSLLEADIPVNFKGAAMKKINMMRYMDPGNGEYYKLKNWVDTFMRVPFGKYESLPINITDGVDKCHDFMEKAQKTLDNAVYGLNDAKIQIMQMLGQLITNPKALGTAIAIQGPMGTGKTTLVKEGISKILNRPFAFIALGGATDSSFLEGHSYTYEGSTWGKIVQILIDSKCMNPVIYFDELDKISDTPKGEEIAGILTHLTDTSQNSQFHDKYFTEIDFDLSKCLFIFSYNDESKINPILKDRMYRIHTKGYSVKQKNVISNNYLLPKIQEQVKFSQEDIIIPEQSINYIVDNHCNKEDGVRNLKRCLEIIYTKLNLYRLMKPGTNLFEEDMSLKVQFPFTVTKDVVDKLIKKNTSDNLQVLYSIYA